MVEKYQMWIVRVDNGVIVTYEYAVKNKDGETPIKRSFVYDYKTDLFDLTNQIKAELDDMDCRMKE